MTIGADGAVRLALLAVITEMTDATTAEMIAVMTVETTAEMIVEMIAGVIKISGAAIAAPEKINHILISFLY